MPGFLKTFRVGSLLESKVGKYVVYAMGEVLLIFVGITLAISFENSAENRRKEELNLGLLEGVQQSLQANADELRSNIEMDEVFLTSLVTVLEAMESGSEWNDSLSIEFGKAMYWTSPFLATAGYESLKQSGLHNVSDENLREEMIHLFERTYAFLIGDLDRSMWSYNEVVILPMIGTELHRIERDEFTTPRVAPRNLSSDAQRLSIQSKLYGRREQLAAGLEYRRAALEETEALMSKLDRFLERED